MTSKEFKQELVLTYTYKVMQQMFNSDWKNYVERDEGTPMGLNSTGKSIMDDVAGVARCITDYLDAELLLFDDSEPEPEVELQEGGYPIFTPIQEVKELYTRTKHALLGGGVNTVAELLPLSRRDLLKFMNFGGRCLTNVNDFLEKYGFLLKTRAW